MKYVLITLAVLGFGILYFTLWDQVVCVYFEDNVICEIISNL